MERAPDLERIAGNKETKAHAPPAIHHCPNLPPEGVTIYLDTHSTLLRRAPTWQLDIQCEATEAELEENHYLEEVGETLWTTSLEIRHCPYCGQQLADPGEEVPADLGRFVHIDSSGWHGTVSFKP